MSWTFEIKPFWEVKLELRAKHVVPLIFESQYLSQRMTWLARQLHLPSETGSHRTCESLDLTGLYGHSRTI